MYVLLYRQMVPDTNIMKHVFWSSPLDSYVDIKLAVLLLLVFSIVVFLESVNSICACFDDTSVTRVSTIVPRICMLVPRSNVCKLQLHSQRVS